MYTGNSTVAPVMYIIVTIEVFLGFSCSILINIILIWNINRINYSD